MLCDQIAPHKALRLVAKSKLTFDDRVLAHRVVMRKHFSKIDPGRSLGEGALHGRCVVVQRYLAQKKTHPPRTLLGPQAWALSRVRGGEFSCKRGNPVHDQIAP